MLIRTPRFILRDLVESDRAQFVAYQMHPRYRALYGYDATDDRRAHELFDLFVGWQSETPRQNYQLGIFEPGSGRLCGSAGLRQAGQPADTAVFGVELTPDDWGRYRLAIEVAGAMIDHGFECLGLDVVIGDTSSGNTRVEKLARWFGGEIVASREGAGWMTQRGWKEVDWAISREAWAASRGRQGLRRTR